MSDLKLYIEEYEATDDINTKNYFIQKINSLIEENPIADGELEVLGQLNRCILSETNQQIINEWICLFKERNLSATDEVLIFIMDSIMVQFNTKLLTSLIALIKKGKAELNEKILELIGFCIFKIEEKELLKDIINLAVHEFKSELFYFCLVPLFYKESKRSFIMFKSIANQALLAYFARPENRKEIDTIRASKFAFLLSETMKEIPSSMIMKLNNLLTLIYVSESKGKYQLNQGMYTLRLNDYKKQMLLHDIYALIQSQDVSQLFLFLKGLDPLKNEPLFELISRSIWENSSSLLKITSKIQFSVEEWVAFCIHCINLIKSKSNGDQIQNYQNIALACFLLVTQTDCFHIKHNLYEIISSTLNHSKTTLNLLKIMLDIDSELKFYDDSLWIDFWTLQKDMKLIPDSHQISSLLKAKRTPLTMKLISIFELNSTDGLLNLELKMKNTVYLVPSPPSDIKLKPDPRRIRYSMKLKE